jgi:hypothetical protein
MDLPKNQVLSRVIGATVDRKEKLVSCQADKTGKRFSNFLVDQVRRRGNSLLIRF